MNQIIFTQKLYKIKIIFIIQLLASIISIIILCVYLLYDNFNNKYFEDIATIIEKNIKISNIYENDINEQLFFGKIYISKINLEYNIFNDFSDELLKISPCKFYGKRLGEPGNICIAGHNYDNNKFFSNLNKIEIFDEIIMENLKGEKYKYIVYEKNEIQPDDLSILKSKKKFELTLLTCNNSNKKRLVVKAYMNKT